MANNVKYLYVRNDWNKRNITIASDLVEEDGKKMVKCAWAFCSNKDKFIKKEGRQIALERLNTNDPAYSASFSVEEYRFYDIAAAILDQIIRHPNTPKKYLRDIEDDLSYFAHCSVNGTPKWASIFR